MSEEWTDTQLKDKRIFKQVEAESLRQINKWDIQERTPFEWLAYLTEEVGELAEAISEYTYRHGRLTDIQKEAIEVATLALKIADMAKDNMYGENDG